MAPFDARTQDRPLEQPLAREPDLETVNAVQAAFERIVQAEIDADGPLFREFVGDKLGGELAPIVRAAARLGDLSAQQLLDDYRSQRLDGFGSDFERLDIERRL